MKKGILIIFYLIVSSILMLGLLLGLANFLYGDSLGLIFIVLCSFGLIIIMLDSLITIGKIKKGIIYSCISSLLKIGIIILLIPNTIYNFKEEISDGVSNLSFNMIIITLLIMSAITSIINIIELKKKKQE